MDHSEAIRLGAPEKYLLGELSAQEREQFEEHFFTCLECADDVKSGAVFVDNARAVMREEAAMQTVLKPATSRGFAPWFRPAWGMAALVVLAGVISYQNVVTIPHLKETADRPQALTSFSLLTAGSRGSAPVIHPPQGQAFGIYVDIPPTQSFPYYTLLVKTAKRQYEVQVSAEQAKDTVLIWIPAGALDSGSAELVISGRPSEGQAVEIARDPFAIEFQ